MTTLGTVLRWIGLEPRYRKVEGDHPSNPSGWWASMASGTKAGVDITEQSALQLSTVWACVRAISEDAAKLPLHIYRRLEPHGRERAVDHPAYRLLLQRPNGEMSAMQFREALTAHAMLYGNGYAEIERRGDGTPVALWPLRPDRVEVRRDARGAIRYRAWSDRGRQVDLPAEDVLHLHGLGFDGVVGYGVVRIARENLGGHRAAVDYGSSMLGNMASPPMALVHPQKLSDDAMRRLRESWEASYRGPENAGRVAILEEGMELKTYGLPPEDAQYLETRQFGVADICRWFRFPPHKAGDLSRATFANIEHQAIEYVTDCLGAWLVRWEQEAARKLLATGEEAVLYYEHNADALLRGDLKTRAEAWERQLNAGLVTINEARDAENRNPLPGDQGSLLRVPSNMTTPANIVAGRNLSGARAPDAGDRPRQPSADEPVRGARAGVAAIAGVAAAQQPVLAAAYRAMLRVEGDKARRAAAKGELAGWVSSFFAGGHLDHVRGALFPAVEAAARSCAAVVPGITDVPAIVMDLAVRHVEASRSALAACPAGKLEELLGQWEAADGRAERDATAAAELLGRAMVRTWKEAAA